MKSHIFTPMMKRAFLTRLAKVKCVSKVCKEIGLCRATVYYHRSVDKEFRTLWENARYSYGTKTINGFQI